MPRAGGEYVYNSRILHPAIALGAVFANIIAIFYWNWYIATWLGVPAMQLFAQYQGWWDFADWAASNTGMVVLGLIAVVVGYLSVAFSMKSYAIIQKIMLIPAIGGPIILIVALLMTSKAEFIGNWNAIAAEFDSLRYEQFIQAAGPLPNDWDWHGTFGAFSGVYALFVYNYAIAYLSGEVKRPDKALMGGNILAVWVPIVLGFLTALGLYRIMAFNFLSASAARASAAASRATRRPTPGLPDAHLDRQRQERLRRLGASCSRSSPSSGSRSRSPSSSSAARSSPGASTAWDRSGSRTSAHVCPAEQEPDRRAGRLRRRRRRHGALAQERPGRAHRRRAAVRLGVPDHRHLRSALPVPQERPGHLGVVAVPHLEDRRHTRW